MPIQNKCRKPLNKKYTFLNKCYGDCKNVLKAAVLQMLKKWKKITVNTGQVIFSGEIYYH